MAAITHKDCLLPNIKILATKTNINIKYMAELKIQIKTCDLQTFINFALLWIMSVGKNTVKYYVKFTYQKEFLFFTFHAACNICNLDTNITYILYSKFLWMGKKQWYQCQWLHLFDLHIFANCRTGAVVRTQQCPPHWCCYVHSQHWTRLGSIHFRVSITWFNSV